MSDQAEKLRALVQQQSEKLTPPVLASESLGPRFKTRTIVVTSGKGGVGKTNLTVNLALAFAKRGKKTLLFDADLGMANLDVLLGISPQHSLVDVIHERKRLDEVIFPISENLELIPGGSGISELANLASEKLESLLLRLSEIEGRSEILLIDTGAGISRQVLDFVLAAHEVIVVTTPEPTAITDAYGMIKALNTQNPGATVHLLVNQADTEQEARSVASKLTMIVERFLEIKLNFLGFVEKDVNVGRAVLQQRPFSSLYPYAVATRRVNILAGTLLVQNDEPSAPEGFFSRFFRRIAK
ncbi:Flagellum site-determining protein YlxH [compost metagenome]